MNPNLERWLQSLNSPWFEYEIGRSICTECSIHGEVVLCKRKEGVSFHYSMPYIHTDNKTLCPNCLIEFIKNSKKRFKYIEENYTQNRKIAEQFESFPCYAPEEIESPAK